MTKGNEGTLSLRVAGSGTMRPKYGRLVPAAPQCLLMPSVIVHNLRYVFWEFRNYSVRFIVTDILYNVETNNFTRSNENYI